MSTLKPFLWTNEAEVAIALLKSLFTLAPIQAHLDPNWLLIMEIDTLKIMAGAVILQRDSTDQKFHLFATSASDWPQPSYDVANHELLTVMVVLHEWRHWLEVSFNPFLVWTNHKNLVFTFAVAESYGKCAGHAHLLTPFTKYKTRRLPRAILPGTQSHPASLLYCECRRSLPLDTEDQQLFIGNSGVT